MSETTHSVTDNATEHVQDVPTDTAAADLFRRHLSTAMSQVSDWSHQALVQHGQELISALPTLARPHRSVTPARPWRALIRRQPTGDRRRSTIVRFNAYALDHPLYTSTATVNHKELLSKGLGRRPDTTFSIPTSGTQSDLRNKIIELYPILHNIPFELMVGQARCKLELIPREKSLEQLKADTKSCGFVRLWVLPDYHICPQITAPRPAASMPAVTLTPAILSTPVVTTTPAIPSTPAVTTTPAIPSTPAVTTSQAIPSMPAITTTPAIPLTPAVTTTPAIPSTPAVTTTPAIPSTPAVTTTPANPSTPAVTTTPAIPLTPAVTTTPAIPLTPAVTTTPAIPSTPAVTTTPAIPSTPAVTTTPANPSTPAVTTTQAIPSMPAVTTTPAILSTPAVTTTPAVEIDYDLQIDIPEIQNTQSDSLYEPAGTPTVLFRRQQTVLDIARDIDLPADQTANQSSAVLNEFIPAVQTAQPIPPSRITDTARERLQQQASTCITGPITDPMLLEVRRNHVLKDALGTIRYSQSDLGSKLQIKFIGEAGVDLGGLRRQFFSLLVYQFSHSALTSGSPGRLTFRKNFVEREKNTFFYLGQLVALSILQDGPGLPVFADCVVNKILNITTNGVNPNDLHPDMVKTLEEMTHASSDRELQDLYFNIYDEREAAGFILPSYVFKKDHIPLLQSALVNNMVLDCRDELDQFIEGLRTHDVLTMVREEKLSCLFSGGKPPVTVADVRGLLNFNYRQDINREAESETGQQFVRFLQATKGDGATVNGITLTPNDVLTWLTGSAEIPAVGFHKQIDIEFGEEERVNTCALCVTLKHLTPAVKDPVLYFTERLINSSTFGVM